MMNRDWHTALAFGAAMLCTDPVAARELAVGPTRVLKVPSQAATVAANGDVVRIDPGVYADCAVWTASRLVIESTAPGVILQGTVCAEKGIFITLGNDITVRGITFAGAAAAPWHNAAGIRVVGANLTVEHSRFLNNENGILAGGRADSVLRVSDSAFVGNGACIEACAHAIYAGEPIFLLDVEHCLFRDTRVAHNIKSRARNTVVRDSEIGDGPSGTSSYLIETPNGGNLLVQNNVMEKGPHTSNAAVAISIGVEGVTNPTGALIVWHNSFRNDTAGRTVFVRNSSGVGVDMVGNNFIGDVTGYETVPAMR